MGFQGFLSKTSPWLPAIFSRVLGHCPQVTLTGIQSPLQETPENSAPGRGEASSDSVPSQ